jgi:penicillin-insensitive murein endopeptidase
MGLQRAGVCLVLTLLSGTVAAQDLPQFRSAVVGPNGSIKANAPAKDLFGSVTTAAPLASRSIGSYARGCLAGGVALPVNARGWQVMRLSRNRNWGHPNLIAYLQQLATRARAIGWSGLLIGDMAQPRGGPMLTGHSSHQIGLDADIWLTPMPNRTLSPQEREDIMAVSMLRDPLNVDLGLWTSVHTRLIKLAASFPEIDRIFVHPAIKQVLCDQAGRDRAWLSKVRPWWGHYYHFHVRLACPREISCTGQPPVPRSDGCGTELDHWFDKLRQSENQPTPPVKPAPAERPLSLGDLPSACRTVLTYGTNDIRVQRQMAADKPAGPPPPRFQFRAGQPRPHSIWGD